MTPGNFKLGDYPETDDARCIELAAIDWDFFERQWWGGVRGKAEMWKAEMSQF